MEKILIHPTYFPNIISFANILYADEVLFEISDYYEKQTYRNRMHIQSANALQKLSVPVTHTKKDGKQFYKEVKISFEFNWPKLHWRSLETAYRTSPYFEFYEDDIKPLFFEKKEKLVEFNIEAIKKIMEILGVPFSFKLTDKYLKNRPEYKDLRFLANAKTNLQVYHELPEYYQLFSDRYGFMPNLSLLDLLFMKGPESTDYLKEVYEVTKDKIHSNGLI